MNYSRHNRGSVLIVALLFLTLFSVLSLHMAYYLSRKNRMLKIVKEDVTMFYFIKGIYSVIIEDIEKDYNIEGFDYLQEDWIRQNNLKPLKSEVFFSDVDATDDLEAFVVINDEAAKLNINYADELVLADLLNILGWPNGRKLARLITEYRQRKGRGKEFTTVDEILVIEGLDVDSFIGEDVNGSGQLDGNEDNGRASFPPDNQNGKLDRGLKDYLTCITDGRININTALKEVLLAQPGMDETLVEAIIEVRKKEPFIILDDLRKATGVSENKFQKIVAWASVRSDWYRISINARPKGSLDVKNFEILVDRSIKPALIRYYRED